MSFSTALKPWPLVRLLAAVVLLSSLSPARSQEEPLVPQLQLEQPSGDDHGSGWTASYAQTPLNGKNSLTFYLRNVGDADLTGITAGIDGANAGDFSIAGVVSASLVPGGVTNVRVEFAPSAWGTRTATLRIYSNDPARPVFVVNLTGQGVGTLNPVFNSPSSIPYIVSGFSATGMTFGQLTLGFAPAPGAMLTVIRNTGGSLVTGNFTDLVEGGKVTATFNGTTYTFVIDYRGASGPSFGRDVVLWLVTPGGSDGTFKPDPISGPVNGMAVQPDGKILVARAGISGANVVVRLNADGSRDLNWISSNLTGGTSNPDGIVSGILIQPDGKIVIVGDFTAVGGVPRNRIARLESTGMLDASFNLGVNGRIWCVAADYQGRLLIGGDFTQVGEVTRNRIARFTTAGVLDSAFVADVNGRVWSIAFAGSSAVVIGGEFTQVGGIPRSRMAWLSPTNGLLYTSPSVSILGTVKCIAVQKDGKFLVGGAFSTVNNVSRTGLVRLTTAGVVDPTFVGSTSVGLGEVKSLALQADGKILVGGSFSQVNQMPISGRIVRLNTDGTLDTGFYTGPGDSVRGITLQPDGKVLVGGDFTTLGGRGFVYFLGRLFNDPATESLSITGPGTVEWTRGGSSPEIQAVTFEISINNGASWQTYASGERISGVWKGMGGGLPSSGLLRALARNVGGRSENFSGFLEKKISFPMLPHLVVEYPAGTPVPDGWSFMDLGIMKLGQAVTRTFTLRNTGTGTLSNLQAFGGPGISLGASTLAPGATTTMTFIQEYGWGESPGERFDYIVLYSNNPSGTYDIHYKVMLVDSIRAWRFRNFGSPENTDWGANGYSPLDDGVPNLLKYAVGDNPWIPGVMPGVFDVDGSALTFTFPRSKAAFADGTVYVVEWSDTLAEGSWSSAGVVQEVVDPGDATESVRATIPSGSGAKRFVRLRVIAPAE